MASITDSVSNSIVEVTMLGPGYGESIVIHIGSGKWIIVDSCVDENNEPAAIKYLNEIGVDLNNVFLVIATHWHDDHVRGLGELFKQCQCADFCFSSVLKKEEFLSFVLGMNKQLPTDKMTSGVKEMASVIKTLQERRKKPKFAAPDRRIDFKNGEQFEHGKDVEIWTLSPSDESITRFLREVGNEAPKERETRRRAKPISPNETSIVLYISFGEQAVLLGADLEEVGIQGWTDIVNSAGRPTNKAAIFKIPHHGSKNAHYDNVWSDMLIDKPLCLLTPYNKGYKLPTEVDVNRILGGSECSYTTKKINGAKKTISRPASIDKQIAQSGVSLKQIINEVGIIRARLDLSSESEWCVELYKGACHLSEINA